MSNISTTLISRNTYTPPNASQVRCNCESILNSSNSPRNSVLVSKTDINIPEVNLPTKVEMHKVYAYVLDMSDKQLMPTTPKNARILLKNNKAKVIKRSPFTIQLNYQTSNYTQPITLGIDSAFKNIGISATANNLELFSAQVNLSILMSKNIQDKSMYRRGRRNRKIRYRQPRFKNRNISKGWFAPSINNKMNAHKQIINKIKYILPISNTIIEVATFDTQKIINPEISGIEYQQGELKDYEIWEYILEKWGRKCAFCGKTNVKLERGHIIARAKGGSRKVSNLFLICRNCNQEQGIKLPSECGHPEIEKYAKIPFKSIAFMNTIRHEIINRINCNYTYGYITKYNRIKLNLEKSHINDAFVIAGGQNQIRCKSFYAQQTRRNNRKLEKHRKRFNRSIRIQRYKIQPNDLLLCLDDNKLYITSGTHSKGRPIFKDRKDISVKKIKLIQYGKGVVFRY